MPTEHGWTTREIRERFYSHKWVVPRWDPEGGTRFESGVSQKGGEGDLIGRETFVQELADVPLTHLHYDGVSPIIEVTSGYLNILEYFGLFLPAAKLLIPWKCAFGHASGTRGWKLTAPVSWAMWDPAGVTWTFRVPVILRNSRSYYHKRIAGTILSPSDVDYWQALRGLGPGQLRRYAKEDGVAYKAYERNPFDMEYPATRMMINNGNVSLDEQIVVPMFRSEDVYKCYQLLFFLFRSLPLDFSILSWYESKKRIRRIKRKLCDSQKLKDHIWEAFSTGFDDYPRDLESLLPEVDNLTLDAHFFRNHLLATFIHSRRKKGAKVYRACEEAADILYQRQVNVEGELHLSPTTVQNKIYRPIIRKLLSTNHLKST